MKKERIFTLICLALLILLGIKFIFNENLPRVESKKEVPKVVQRSVPKSVPKPTAPKEPLVLFPIAQFEQRITKKPFGIYITPQNSPVMPERFTGYHTGDDAEYGDVAGNVPVYAVYSGQIVLSEWVSGYGGTIVLHAVINGEDLYILYGHLNPSSLTPVNSNVTKGEQIAILGQGYTQETDGERKHLHFSIHKGSLDLRGYVQSQSELSGWYDPLEFYSTINNT